jgi:hypothetical protein
LRYDFRQYWLSISGNYDAILVIGYALTVITLAVRFLPLFERQQH